MDSVAAALAALDAVGARLKEAKAAADAPAVEAALAEYQQAKAALDAVVRPAVADALAAGDDARYNALAPAFEKVMTKSEKKKRDKELKKKKKAAAAAAAAGSGGAGSGGAGSSSPAESKAPSKKELKRLEKARKKAEAKARARAAREAAPPSSSSSSSSSSTSSTAPPAGGGYKSKRAKTAPSSPSGAAAAAARFAAPVPPRVSVAGRVDPTRAPAYAVRQVLVQAHLAPAGALPFPVTLGRFQTSNLFTDVPCLDTPGDDGRCISGQDACCDYLQALAGSASGGSADTAAAVAEWRGWASSTLAPLYAALAPAAPEVGVVFPSVTATKARAAARRQALAALSAADEAGGNPLSYLASRLRPSGDPASDALTTGAVASDVSVSLLVDAVVRLCEGASDSPGSDSPGSDSPGSGAAAGPKAIASHEAAAWARRVLSGGAVAAALAKADAMLLSFDRAEAAAAVPTTSTVGVASMLSRLLALAVARAFPALDMAPGGVALGLGNVTPNTRKQADAAARPVDFSSGAAMSVMRHLKGQSASVPAGGPAGIAAAIAAAASECLAAGGGRAPAFPLVAHVAADRGYLNFTLDARALARRAAASCFAAPGLRADAPRRIAVDFSSPNIAKEMHVGHLRSTIIGETICRVLASCGHDVQRINHVGDWGTQFGMLLCHLFDVFPNFTTTPPDISDLNVFYKEAKKRFDAEPAFKVRSQEMVPELQGGGNARATAGWQALYEVSKQQFSQVYERLDVTNEIVGESFYQPLLPPVVDELRAKGLIVEDMNEKTGKTALVAWVKDAIQIPLFLVKSDGGYGYDSTDAAAMKYRLKTLRCDWLIYVTDLGQADHFKGIFSLGNRAGWLGPGTASSNVLDLRKDPEAVAAAKRNWEKDLAAAAEEEGESSATAPPRIDHVGFGVVQGKDKKRFKTRSGETVRLVDLLDEAKRRVEAELSTRLAQGSTYVTADQVERAAAAIGYGAVKYCDLRATRTKDYVFDYDEMLSMSGDTAVYLLYAHARFVSIVRKSGKDPRQLLLCAGRRSGGGLVAAHSETQERDLIVALAKLPDMIELFCETLMPHHICAYLYDLAGKISAFTRDCRVLGSENEDARLVLCEASAVTMRTCLNMLGIEAPMRL